MNIKLFIVKSAIFALILWTGSYHLAKKLDASFVQDRSNKEMWILSQRGLVVDYAVAGSSRALNNVDATSLLKKTGGTAINIAYGGQSIMDMYLTLHLFLKHENHIRNVLLQIDGADLDYSHKFRQHLYLPYLADSEVAETEREMIGWKRYLAMKACPLEKYWEYNDYYNLQRLRELRSGVSSYDMTGGSELLYDDSYQVFPAIEQEPEFVPDLRSRRYLDQIVQLTRSHGINLIVFSAPMYHRDRVFRKYDEASRGYIARYCQEQSILYLDFTDANFDRAEFRDYGHLNGRGALRFTQMLADSLNETHQNRSSLRR